MPEFITNQQIQGDWYLVNDLWYDSICKGGRLFSPGQVGYIVGQGKKKK